MPLTAHSPPIIDKHWRLEYLPKANYFQWDKFVASSPQSTIYGTSEYLTALQCSFRILVVVEKEEIIGGIVLAKDSRKKYANPLLCKYLGIYFSALDGSEYTQETKRRKIVNLLISELSNLPSFNYFFHRDFKTYLPFHLRQYSNRVCYSYWIDLKQQSIQGIKAKFHVKLRSELNFAQKQHYSIERDIGAAAFITICEKTFVQKGYKFPFSFSFLTNYYLLLKKNNTFQSLAIKDAEGNLMAVAGLLYEQKTTSLILSGFDATFMKRSANELLIFECIKLAKKQSDFFDFEGSMLPSIESFYRKFGGDYVPYLNIYKENLWEMLYNRMRTAYRTIWNKKK